MFLGWEFSYYWRGQCDSKCSIMIIMRGLERNLDRLRIMLRRDTCNIRMDKYFSWTRTTTSSSTSNN